MLHRERFTPPVYIYPVDEWKIIEQQFALQFLGQAETIFATANGYLGMRGNFEEGAPAFESGTFINGFYESWPIVYGEEAYGFAKTGQTMLNVTDSKIIRLYVDDEPFYLPTARSSAFIVCWTCKRERSNVTSCGKCPQANRCASNRAGSSRLSTVI